MNLGAVFIILLLMIFVVTIGIIYSISHYLSIPGGILISLAIVWLLIRKAVEVSIFPGSSWLWRRGVELNYCRELSIQISEKIKSLKDYLLYILAPSSNNYDQHTHNSKSLINSLILNYLSIEKKISSRQQRMLKLLSDLKAELEKIKILVNEIEEFTMLDWLEIRLESSMQNKLELKENSKEPLIKAIKLCESIAKQLEPCYNTKNCFYKTFDLLFNDTIGSIDYMRADLKQRFNCEEIVLMNGKASINCMLITPDESSGSTILFCNPNAGYYEFTYFQCEWLEFYLSKGISVFLWNYRGFGKSSGSPGFTSLIEDGKCIIEWIKARKNAEKVGIHGESLGGCIAIHIAEACGCDFLLADRTFANLSDTVLFNMNRLAFLFYKLSVFQDIDSVTSYLNLSCYKVIAGDSDDRVIADLASLKSGVAVHIICKSTKPIGSFTSQNKWKNLKCILPSSSCLDFLKSLKIINKLFERFSQELQLDKCQVAIKTESFEDNEMKTILNKIVQILSEVDAGGTNLISILNKKNSELELCIWLMVLELWGSFSEGENIFTSSMLVKAIADLKLAELELKENERAIWKEVEIIIKTLEKILSIVHEKRYRESSGGEGGDESISETERLNVGFLLPISCGHSGQFNTPEKILYERHLLHSGLI